MKCTESLDGSESTGKPIDRIRIYYSLASGILGIVLFLTFCLLPSKVDDAFKLDIWRLATAVSVCILIPYLFSGIWCLLDKLEDALTRIELDPGCKMDLDVKQLMNVMRRPWIYVSVMIFIISSFIALDILQAEDVDTFLFSGFPSGPWNSWEFKLDIYLLFSRYAVDFLLANLIWLVINMAWIFEKLGSSYLHRISVNTLDLDGFGGLGDLKGLIQKTSLFYFTSLSLAVVSYAGPFNANISNASSSNWMVLICYENILYLLMIMVGSGLLFKSLRSLKKILSEKVAEEINVINESYSRLVARLNDLSNADRENPINNEIIRISIALAALQKERDRLIRIGGHDYVSFVTFVTSLIVPIATKVLVSLLQLQGSK